MIVSSFIPSFYLLVFALSNALFDTPEDISTELGENQ